MLKGILYKSQIWIDMKKRIEAGAETNEGKNKSLSF